jgi:hypothetical protein
MLPVAAYDVAVRAPAVMVSAAWHRLYYYRVDTNPYDVCLQRRIAVAINALYGLDLRHLFEALSIALHIPSAAVVESVFIIKHVGR